MDDHEKQAYKKAKKRVEDIKGFYIHLAIYFIVNLGLFIMNAVVRNEGDGWWFYWATIGWGIGLLIHAFVTFIEGSKMTSQWEKKKIKELMEKE